MKILRKFVFALGGVLACAVLALKIAQLGLHSYSEIKTSCDEAMAKSPNAETLEEWMDEIGIPETARGSYGNPEQKLRDPLKKAVSCKYFQINVRGGYLSRHVCYGYFYLSANGEVVDYTIYSIYYGM